MACESWAEVPTGARCDSVWEGGDLGPVQVSAPRAARMPDVAQRGQAAQEAREACLEAPSWWPEKRSCLCPRALAVSGQLWYGHIIW